MEINELSSGQVISLRDRLRRIDAIYNNSRFMELTCLDGYEAEQRTFYLPKEIQSITLAQNSFPNYTHPGDPAQIKKLVQAWKLNLMFSDSPFISLHKASIIPTKFQLVPVLLALKSNLITSSVSSAALWFYLSVSACNGNSLSPTSLFDDGENEET